MLVLPTYLPESFGGAEQQSRKFEDVWGQLFPAEQTRIVQLLVRRVTVTSEGLVIDLRTDGVSGVMRDMMAPRKRVAAE